MDLNLFFRRQPTTDQPKRTFSPWPFGGTGFLKADCFLFSSFGLLVQRARRGRFTRDIIEAGSEPRLKIFTEGSRSITYVPYGALKGNQVMGKGISEKGGFRSVSKSKWRPSLTFLSPSFLFCMIRWGGSLSILTVLCSAVT